MAKKRKYTTCKNCKKKTNANMKVCQHCGTKLSSNINVVTIGFIILALLAVFELLNREGSVKNDLDKLKRKFNIGIGSEESADIPMINNEVLYKGNDVVIISKGMARYEEGYCLNLSIANNSTMNLLFNAKSYAVNGVMMATDGNELNFSVAAGRSELTSLKIPDDTLRKYNMEKIKYLDLILYASNNGDKEELFNTGQVEIKTDFYNGRTKMLEGKNIYNEKGLSINFLKASNSSYYFCIANESGKAMTYDMDKITINDATKLTSNSHLSKRELLNSCQDVIAIKLDDYVKDKSIDSIESIDWNMKIKLSDESSSDVDVVPIKYVVK